jgi:hypothetical protein
LLDGCIAWLPEVDLPPPQEPEAEHAVVLVLAHCSIVLWPCWMLVGLATRFSVGAGVGGGFGSDGVGGALLLTPTMIVLLVPPRGPEHPKVNRLDEVTRLDSLPRTGFDPLQLPQA